MGERPFSRYSYGREDMNIRAAPRRRDWFRILWDLRVAGLDYPKIARLCGRNAKSVQHWANGGDPKDTDARMVLQLYAKFCPSLYHEHEKQHRINPGEQ